jgi:hypothetical protein
VLPPLNRDAAAPRDPAAADVGSSKAGGFAHAVSSSAAAALAPPPQQQQEQQAFLHAPLQQQQQHHPQQDAQQDEQQVLLELQQLLSDKGIHLPELRFGQQRTLCPNCQGGRSREDCFSVNVSEAGSAVWTCHRGSCGFSGGVTVRSRQRRSRSSSSSSSSSGGTSTSSAGAAAVVAEQQVRQGSLTTNALCAASTPPMKQAVFDCIVFLTNAAELCCSVCAVHALLCVL